MTEADARGGVLQVSSGGDNTATLVSSGGEEVIFAGGKVANTTLLNGGTELVSSGGQATYTGVSSGGSVVVASGGVAGDGQVGAGDGMLEVPWIELAAERRIDGPTGPVRRQFRARRGRREADALPLE